MQLRTERDPLGEFSVPADAYYGIQTARAVANFPISGLRAPTELVVAAVLIKKAAAQANAALGRLGKGTYGDCFECGEAIAGTRLRAVPFAVRCRHCEEVHETVRATTAHHAAAARQRSSSTCATKR